MLVTLAFSTFLTKFSELFLRIQIVTGLCGKGIRPCKRNPLITLSDDPQIKSIENANVAFVKEANQRNEFLKKKIMNKQ